MYQLTDTSSQLCPSFWFICLFICLCVCQAFSIFLPVDYAYHTFEGLYLHSQRTLLLPIFLSFCCQIYLFCFSHFITFLFLFLPHRYRRVLAEPGWLWAHLYQHCRWVCLLLSAASISVAWQPNMPRWKMWKLCSRARMCVYVRVTMTACMFAHVCACVCNCLSR